MADFMAMIITPLLVWFLLSYASAEGRESFKFSDDRLWTRFGITIAVRCVTLYVLRVVVNRRTQRAKKELEIWSVFGTYDNDVSVMADNVNMFTIRLGMDSRLRRNLAAAISTYLQNRSVCLEDVELFIERYLRDIDLPVADMAFGKLNALHYTITNLRNSFWYFILTAILMFFSVLGAFDQRNRWVFWNL